MENPSVGVTLSPEQEDTARLLGELLGRAVGLRYKDFCLLSAGAFPLTASKPMAAHALRELDSMLRGVLAVPMDAKAPEDPNANEKREEVGKILKGLNYDENAIKRALDGLEPRTKHKDQIRKILTRLGFDPTSDIAIHWISTIDNYQNVHGRWFHQSLEVDDDFRTKIQLPFDTVVRAIAIALRGHYASLMRRVKALTAMTDRGHAAKLFAREIPRAMQLQWYFFKNLTTGEWLIPLRNEGLLLEPPRFAEEEGEGRYYAEWPAGDYLRRMAAVADETVRKGVMEALCSVAEARHPDILQNGIAILAELPAAEAARLADLAVGWLKRDGRVLHSQAPNDLVRKLAESGEVAATTKVARELFRLWEDNGKIRNQFGEHMYEHYLPLLIGPLIAACGSEFLEVLIDCLRQALTVLGDYSYASFSRTPVSHVNSPPFDLSDMLMSAVRQVAEELVRSRAAPMSKVIGMLAVNKYKIFTRITLHILAEEP